MMTKALSKSQKLDQFIVKMPCDIWYSTKDDPEIVDQIKDWIDSNYLWPDYFLTFSNDFSKFKKTAYGICLLRRQINNK